MGGYLGRVCSNTAIGGGVIVPLPGIVKRAITSMIDRVKASIISTRLVGVSNTLATPEIAYLHEQYPSSISDSSEIQSGGAVKYIYMNRMFPHAGLMANILYGVSSSHYVGSRTVVKRARALGIKLVWNQNGTFVPFAQGETVTRTGNARIAPLLHAADYVFYQSKFAKLVADRYLGVFNGPSEILYNAVDTDLFRPFPTDRPTRDLTLLIAGSHNDAYRIPLALKTLSRVIKTGRRTRLIIAGQIGEENMNFIKEAAAHFGVAGRLEFFGPYTQDAAPQMFAQADLLIHTQYADVCPSVVIEAMACGLPVVYSATGGTPELVGDEAGYGIPGRLDWLTPQLPSSEALAQGISHIADRLNEFSEAARERAVSCFDIKRWIERHREVFEMLLEKL